MTASRFVQRSSGGLLLVSVLAALFIGWTLFSGQASQSPATADLTAKVRLLAELVKPCFAETSGRDRSCSQAFLRQAVSASLQGRADDSPGRMQVEILGPAGEPWPPAESRPGQAVSAAPEVLQAASGGTGFAMREGPLGPALFIAAEVAGDAAGTLGFVRLSWPLSGADSGRGHWLLLVLLGLNLLLIFALLAGWLLSKDQMRRAARVTRMVNRMVRGDYPRELPDPGRDEIGALTRAVLAFARHTEEQTRELTDARNQLEVVGSGITEGVLTIGQDRELLHINQVAADLFQVTVESAVGRPLNEVISTPEVDQAVDTVLSQQTDRTLVIRYGSRWLELALMYLKGLPGRGAILIFNDVTEVRRLERVRSDFVANASHELKTPISAILGIADTVLDDAEMKSKTRKRFIERIRRQTVRMNALVNGLLMLSRMDAIDRVPDSRPVCLNDLLQEVSEAMQDDAADRQLQLTLELPEEAVWVDGDARALGQIVSNLLENAFKHSEKGGVVSLALSHLGQMASIQVQDKGIGIPKEEQNRIFERFYQVDKARSREKGVAGTGLGLSIVKHAARIHGGDVKVESIFGVGSTFTVRIPLGAAETAQDQPDLTET